MPLKTNRLRAYFYHQAVQSMGSIAQLQRDNALLKHKIALKDVLTDLKLEPGTDWTKKK
jgi:hypothetical protein